MSDPPWDILSDEAYYEYLDKKRKKEEIEEYTEKTILEKSHNAIKKYLATYGDKIQERINYCLIQANELFEKEYYGPALTVSITAIEIIIKYLYLKPLLQSTFMSVEWSNILVEHILSKKSNKEKRKLLLKILRQWGIELAEINLSNNKQLYESLENVINARNDFVHEAKPVEKEYVKTAINCINKMMEIIKEISEEIGFDFSEDDIWCQVWVKGDEELGEYEIRAYNRKDPFE